jgi:hypothetical protein
MKKKIAVLVLFLFPVLALAATFTNKFSDGLFTNYFPGEVKESRKQGTTADGKVTFTDHSFIAVDTKGVAYVVGHTDYDGEVTYDLDKGLTGSRDAALTQVASDDRANSTLGGLPARYATFTGTSKTGHKLFIYERIARSGRRVWIVAVISEHNLQAIDFNEFFTGFALQP